MYDSHKSDLEHRILRRVTQMGSMVNILWTVAVVLVLIWLVGLLLGWAATGVGWMLHLLLVVAIVVIAYNLLTGRRTV